ncbi:hypothetical protein [Altericroceibacterium endophyticum]|uniref:Esterase n=1 Tax=Altericroceibacterium endophyticum TaxID=1808508 RepID=A0A6I4T5E8_9SPHN|nr:hypothetical protein [Altericroceibacterium endophyticum]MXO64955.1 hypothetical protein [Altericroceibacterium endophyticum]
MNFKSIIQCAVAGIALTATPSLAETFTVTIPETAADGPFDGRVLVMLSKDDSSEPRDQIKAAYDGAQVFGVTVDGLKPGQSTVIDTGVLGYPREDLSDIPAGQYQVQAVLHRYDTYTLENGKTVKLPAPRGAGQNWRKEPGNLVSTVQTIDFDPARDGTINVALDQVNPEIEEPEDTKYIRHIKIKSEKLSKFWGRDIYLRAHVLVPEGFDDHPEAHYPLMIFHGHFPADFGGFRTSPPDPDLECEYSERFSMPCYNKVEQQEAYDFYQKWKSDDFPRYLVIEIDHSNPYYDDSYAVNSANLGPYGDALTYELIPAVEKEFRGLGEGWSRFTYGGSTGGWEALGVQVKYPEEYNGAFAACPDPIDFRRMMLTNIYEDENAYGFAGDFGEVKHPGHRDYLGQVSYTMEDENRLELVLGDKNRSGGQWDIWEAVYSPMGEDGYPERLWDKRTGKINPAVAEYWRENYDLRYIMERDWETLGPKLQGKVHIYVGDMDNYYLNDAVYLAEDFLEKAEPPYQGEVDYGDRAEHCWNGDHANPNAISRLRYNTFYLPKILKRIEDSAPEGADLTSWKY